VALPKSIISLIPGAPDTSAGLIEDDNEDNQWIIELKEIWSDEIINIKVSDKN